METGDNILQRNFLSDPDLDHQKFKDCHTIVQLAGDGMSIAVFNSSRKYILASDNYEWDFSNHSKNFIEYIENIFARHPLKFTDCQTLKFILVSDKISLVPQDLYNENRKSSYIQFSSRIEDKNSIYTDEWNEHRAVALYSPDADIIQWIEENYPAAGYIHSSTALKNLYNYFPHSGIFAFLMMGNGFAELFMAREGKFIFYNYFKFGVEEDVLYYVLFALEQNKILAPEIELYIGGKLHKKQKLWLMLQDYIGNVKPMEIPAHFQLSPALNQHTINRYINLFGGI